MSSLLGLSLSILTTTLLPFFAKAQSSPEGQIQELDSGACWVQQSVESPGWKIASFNDNATFFVWPDEQILSAPHKFETKLTEKLKLLFPNFPPSKYKLHLHCSGAGHQVLITVMNEKTPLCIWAKKSATSNASLDIHTVLPNPHPVTDSACYGVSPASFLFVMNDGADPAVLEKYLLRKYRTAIKSTRVSKVLGYIHVQLKKKFAFKEREVRELFLKDATVAAQIRNIEFDGAIITTGQELFLLEGTFSGF